MGNLGNDGANLAKSNAVSATRMTICVHISKCALQYQIGYEMPC